MGLETLRGLCEQRWADQLIAADEGESSFDSYGLPGGNTFTPAPTWMILMYKSR